MTHTHPQTQSAVSSTSAPAPRLPRTALLHTASGYQLSALADPALTPHQIETVYLPDLEPGGLDAFDIVIVADREHPGLLARRAADIWAVAERGGVLVIFGENAAHEWVPGITWEARPTNFWWWRTGEDHGMRIRNLDDQVWPYFTKRAMIWHHHGIFQPPVGAIPLVTVEENGVEVGATTYIDRVSTPGEIFMTTMDPVFHHGAGFMPGATQLLCQTLRWAEDRAIARIASGQLAP
ncbi:hypothetical protein JOF28_000787 [Leucobacter exalbidus]|uniref:Uncharacterized protein n=1 Tax=Leucobacter exalbidus TaxID=662960 RepID=A0A940PLY6_9MICO|nr:hypothetical protein [Leucobacter exalbidus]MBP1325555.1 hypothetical protein [Leucobacter exalbidus]